MAIGATIVVDKLEQSCDGSNSKSSLCIDDEFRFLLEDGALVPAEANHAVELPPWFDWDKFRRGQLYFRKNYFALFVSKLCGLLVVLTVPSILRVLVLTRQSGDPVTAFKRYLSTLTHMLDWYDGDLLEPTSRAHRSLLSVRLRHCTAARKARKVGFGTITQLDMALTQFGFMGFGLVAPEKLGISGTPEEQEGFVHFWRTVGFLLGIEDRFNLCKENVEDTKKVCQTVLEQVLVPALKVPVEGFDVMSHALIDGMWTMVPFLEYEAFMGFLYHLAGVESPMSSKSLYSRCILSYQIFVHEILLGYWLFAWFARPLHNMIMWLSVFLTQRMPLLAYLKFGRNQIY